MKKRIVFVIFILVLLCVPVSAKNMVKGNDTLATMVGEHKVGAVFELSSSVYAYRLLGFTEKPIASGSTVFVPIKDFELNPTSKDKNTYESPTDNLFFSYIFKGKGTFTVTLTGSDLKNTKDNQKPPFMTETTVTIIDPATLVAGGTIKEKNVITKRTRNGQDYSQDAETGDFLYDPVVLIKGGHSMNPYGSYAVKIVAKYSDLSPDASPYKDGYSGNFSIRVTSEV